MKNEYTKDLSQKEKDAFDRQIQRYEDKMVNVKHKYDEQVSQYAELPNKRHPEKKAECIKEALFEAYTNSERSLEQIISYM